MRSSRSSEIDVTQLIYELIDMKRKGTRAGPQSDIPPAGKQHLSKPSRDLVLNAVRKVCATERMASTSSFDDGEESVDGLCWLHFLLLFPSVSDVAGAATVVIPDSDVVFGSIFFIVLSDIPPLFP